MDALRTNINTQGIKTKQIVFQYPDGSFPEAGAVLNVTDVRGHTDWTRAPHLDSVTLVDASGNEGMVTYTDASGLLVNNIPVGGGGGVGSGGTNISVTGLGVINFDPAKGGGVDMSGNPITRLKQLEFDGSANILFGNVTGLHYNEDTKVLTVHPQPMPSPVLPPEQGLVVIGSIKAPLLTNASVSNADVIGYNTVTGEFEVQPAGGGGGGGVTSVVAGTNIGVDNTNPIAPIVRVNVDQNLSINGFNINNLSGLQNVGIAPQQMVNIVQDISTGNYSQVQISENNVSIYGNGPINIISQTDDIMLGTNASTGSIGLSVGTGGKIIMAGGFSLINNVPPVNSVSTTWLEFTINSSIYKIPLFM